jgi:hypothetical protein
VFGIGFDLTKATAPIRTTVVAARIRVEGYMKPPVTGWRKTEAPVKGKSRTGTKEEERRNSVGD